MVKYIRGISLIKVHNQLRKGGDEMEEKGAFGWIASILLVIGALNWGLIGLKSFSSISYDWDLIALVFGSIPWLAAIVYLLVALSGIWLLIKLFD